MKKRNDLLFHQFRDSLERILTLLEEERKRCEKQESKWNLGELECVEKEIKNFYNAAKNNALDFSYQTARWRSTYLMTDTMEDLFHTALGKEISAAHNLYVRLYKQECGIFAYFPDWELN
ncbi:MAG: hypothetical protein J6M34_02125 [Clostridia bacterium]|nr:hypothetical protein [Clostridia bacterium]